MKIEEIDGVTLFRIVANRLWIRFDVGGISVGRSYQSELLEGFMDFFEVQDLHRDVEGCIFQEAIRRESLLQGQPEVQLALGFTEMSVLTDAEFAFVALCEMCRWYREDAEKAGFLGAEHPRLATCLKSLCFAAFPDACSEMMSQVEYSRLAYVFDSRDRRWIRFAFRNPIWGFERFGTDPWS